MIKALIIDDEPLARSIIVQYLLAYADIEIVAECGNGFEGLKAINEHQPQLVFLDIQMPKITGFEMLELLDEMPSIIFTTAYDEFALKAFEANAIDYLLKPFDQERFNKAVDKFLANSQTQNHQQKEKIEITAQQNNTQNERIVVKTGNKIKVISVYDITHLAADDDYVNIHTAEGAFLKNQTLAFFEKNLNPKLFVRVHRSYIVKIDQITKLEPYDKDGYLIILKTGEKIPVSKTGYPKLKAVLGI
ncbi:DNA-binding response regulator [Pedobacter psychrophilus]|uniref:DNA-binding response regulator n=1 Tax=Pedobacter psychrophilus TaxID=1826909 RepID=A0A179DKK1_9SPHI|nr:LytTR family transcriptional regulator DNA-binding domain-containing protein [Pedobacter psychrophilus]OAQ41646.1 DNA-binding response regulator [Pedobacter psychrophilus]